MSAQPSDSAADVRELGAEEIEEVLRRNHVGRLAFGHGTRIGIVPVHYVYADGWIYGRTSPGEKTELLSHNRWVAFEVDEVEALFRWRSVVVHGAFYVLDPDERPSDLEKWQSAVERLRKLIPDALGEKDPTPHRNIIFRIAVQESTGREAS